MLKTEHESAPMFSLYTQIGLDTSTNISPIPDKALRT